MATNKHVKEIRSIAKKWDFASNSLNFNPVRKINIYRLWNQYCELPCSLMLREIQDWLDNNEVSYKFEPEYLDDGRFVYVHIVIE
jgi:hypothetical protein